MRGKSLTVAFVNIRGAGLACFFGGLDFRHTSRPAMCLAVAPAYEVGPNATVPAGGEV